jgi:hypothetical protein
MVSHEQDFKLNFAFAMMKDVPVEMNVDSMAT